MLRFLAALCLSFGLCLGARPASAQSMLEGNFDPAVPTLTAVAGHGPTERISSPAEITDYLQALASAAPDRTRLVEYARSWENRPLNYLVITSAANMARLDTLRGAMDRVAAGDAAAVGDALPVTWLSYGVHGNEISSSDAALALAYHLLASQGDSRVDTILSNSVVVIDPSQNPDGRARFVSGFRQALGIVPSGDRYAAEHDEPWPGGRPNHYLFDLNRDWFALTQPETRGKVAAVRDWHPVVLIDAHEMGGDSSYFFPPSADPFNPYVTERQKQKQILLGRNHAAWFDRLGIPYFTREVYDLFYPGYGDTWPTLNGAVAETFEQASARGLVWDRADGTVLTYGDGVRNHFIGTFAAAETVANNASLFLTDYAGYRRSAIAGEVGKGSYIIDLSVRRWNAEALARRLALQGFAIGRMVDSFSVCGKSYPSGALVVDKAQPGARLLRSLLDKTVPLPPDWLAQQEDRRSRDLPHNLYDVTAWSVGLMSGLSVSECGSTPAARPIAAEEPIPALASGSGDFGIAVPWTDSGQVRLVTEALRAGITGRTTDTDFRAAGRAFPRGTVIFARGDNADGALAEVQRLAARIGAETVALDSGWVESGPNLGSESFARLSLPRVAMLWDEGISSTSAGALRYVLEQRFGLPVTPIRTGSIARADLSRYDVLLAPDGRGNLGLGDDGKAAVTRFVRGGGVLVAVEGAIPAFAEGDEALFKTKAESRLAPDETADAQDEDAEGTGTAYASEAEYLASIRSGDSPPDEQPGALLATAIDADSYLSAGYGDGPVVLAGGSMILTPLARTDGTNVVRFSNPDELLVSGYLWDENRRQLAFKPYMFAQPNGDGLAIGFTQDPSTRGYLDGLDLLIANAVIAAPARTR